MTAEFAAALPAALVCLAVGIGAIQAGGQQLRLIDAAAVDARLLGRGDPAGGDPVGGTAQQPEPDRTIERSQGMVCVTLSAPSAVVGLGATGLRISGRACAVDEAIDATG
ncbi:TadE family type IV pilus minor pilin [Leifsonia sp. NPDC058194]|uniref:TadE family type IV pilus minor pilin n=1 Tax=Leifsonia sp. NPDC058194 TaxID=3346374 RepID=UPI0036DB0A4A